MNGLVGFGFGMLVTAVAAWVFTARLVRRTRRAERRASAAERLAEVGALTGGLAHEIRNPLSTLALNAQLLEEGLRDAALPEEERQRMIRRIGSLRRETERLGATLEDFLQYAGEMRLSRESARLNDIVDELLDFFAPQATQQGVRLRADLTREMPAAPLDVSLVKQAVLNLLLNAVQAMSRNAPGTPRELILRTAVRGGREGSPRVCELRVIDTGPGIAPEMLAKIFQPYFSTKSGGTGLGLPTSRRIVEAHGGELEVYSEPGRGTEFVLVFPAAAERER